MNNQLQKGIQLNNRYEIIKCIGQGGFGITYIAKDILMNTDIALKEYFPQHLVESRSKGEVVTLQSDLFEQGKERFLSEAQMLASLFEVPGIVKVLDYFKENNTAYIVMEYITGISLIDWLERRDELCGFEEVCSMLEPVMDALNKIHKEGLLHRDISPDNIMVTEEGAVKLLDFGAAREFFEEKEREKTMTVLVKAGYAPPEQYESKGKQGPWTDIYALCGVMYEMMTGCMPQDSIERQLYDQLYLPSAYGADIPADKEEVFINKGLSLDVTERYKSISQMKADFFGEVKAMDKTPGVRRWIIGTAAFILIIFATLLVLLLPSDIEMGEPAAGSYDRGSEEYEEFVNYVKTNGVQNKDGSYTLTEETVLAWGQRGNRNQFDITVDEFMKKLDFDFELKSSERENTVEFGEYGIINTSYVVRDVYSFENDGEMKVIYDVISNNVCRVDILKYSGDKATLATEICEIIFDVNVDMNESLNSDATLAGYEENGAFCGFLERDGDNVISAGFVWGPEYYWP